MSAARFMASALVFGGFMLYGSMFKLRKRREINELTSLIGDLNELESSLRILRLPAVRLAERLSESGSACEFWRDMAIALEKGSSPAGAFESAEHTLANKTAASVLRELFAQFGSSDAETESKRILLAAETLIGSKAKADAEFEKSCKLRSSISALMGAAAALILL